MYPHTKVYSNFTYEYSDGQISSWRDLLDLKNINIYEISRKGIAEQYGISINKEMITNLGITKDNREVIIFFDSNSKSIVIKNSKDNELN